MDFSDSSSNFTLRGLSARPPAARDKSLESFSFPNDIPFSDWSDWRWQMGRAVLRRGDLVRILGKEAVAGPAWDSLLRVYPCRIPPYYMSLLRSEDALDPLTRQAFPDLRELEGRVGEDPDPLEEERHTPVPGIIRRYGDRCLLLATDRCALHCRHCNRKRLWRRSASGSRLPRLRRAVDWISRTPAIREVILSGGDPLTGEDGELDWLLGSLRAIPHVEVLRLGSRVPVVLPMRITGDLCRILQRHRPLWLNTQFNHPKEITEESAAACDRILTRGIPVSSQSVLLRGVNDRYEVLRDLFRGLQRISVRPYYLFQCDAVTGTGHFRTSPAAGMEIMERLWRDLSGLCLPRYVQDLPGEGGKVLLHRPPVRLPREA
jgi:lysine 2,3-aminomutase